VYRSTNGGASWELRSNGLPEAGVSRLSAAVRSGNTRLHVGTRIGLYFSDDRGENWQQCPNLPGGYHLHPQASKVDSNLVFVSGDSTDIYKSIDGGDHWDLLDVPPGGDELREIVCDPVDANIIYASWGQIGIFRSNDGGNNWEDINSNLPRYSYYQVTAIAINPLNTDELYACPNAYGIYVTYNGGRDWEPFNEGLWSEFTYAASTIIDPQDTCRIFLATYGKSVWSYTKTATGIDNDHLQLPANISLRSYPNPFNSAVMLSFRLPHASRVSIDIHNILGQKIIRLFEGTLLAGVHRQVWKSPQFPSGLYFARICVDGKPFTHKMMLLK
jgi:hypothetical protein